MKKINYLLTVLLLLTGCFMSCSSDDESDIVGQPKEYELLSIMWKFDENSGDNVEIISEKLPEKVIYNNTGISQPIEHNSLENVKQTSYFECGNKDAEFLSKWTEKIEIAIPAEPSILSSYYSYLVGGIKAPLEFMKENELEMTTIISSRGELAPNTKVTYSGTVYFKRITATYCLQFAQVGNRFAEIEIAGKWTGMIYDHSETEETFDIIK